ncbi:hypothetical protein PSC71_09380 [Devosia sp. J2-20]|jgi:hypothetical protein|uniref:PepSY domain-containing protein n=1 Tax=Devosia litorisediminis TaxID=2829817 RepID=A0A942EDX7_9HYPH|nr:MULTISPECIES: hypothetical protein [Devosia]MBS3849469.1 hypothetical protein [Devosia litorisediminis]WDR00925.1 hypothetical protein PSC71_09380 [Devosia sp. J2-20]
MIKTLAAAAFATVSLIAVAVPAQAANTYADASYSVADNEASIIQRLTEKGVDVQGVEEWSGYVRAFVTNADGSTSMAIYDPIYLNEVNFGAL